MSDDPNDFSRSYSQYGEDLFVEEFFGNHPGRFLEIGALDGVRDSNCRRLALHGWTGVAIEANPFLYCQLAKTYQNSTNVSTMCALVMGTKSIRVFHLNQDGLSTTHPDVFEALHRRVAFHGYCHLPSVTPDEILEFYHGPFEFVSLDAEGVDIEIAWASKNLLQGTRLLCIETDLPGQGPNADYQQRWGRCLEHIGFTKVVHKTHGNTLLTRA